MNIFVIYVLLGVVATAGMIARMKSINQWTKVCQYIVAICVIFPIWPAWLIATIVGSEIDRRNAFKCAWCGAIVDTRDMEAVKSHAVKCENHPLSKHIIALHERIEQLERFEAPHD